ncbi:MAG: sigma-70 family RNA polymerase sigma factor [bacterium]|nr:sigma-70 family RNA polymerase sigma factor [bacterium]
MTTSAARLQEVALPHLDAVYRMARRLAGGAAEAEDLVQETFVRALKAIDRFELREHGAKPWLFKILHNAFYTQAGKSRRQPTLLDDVDFDHFAAELDEAQVETSGPIGAAGFDWDNCDQELKQAVEQLQPEYRTVLLLWALEDMSYKQIAEICRCPVGTVMSRLYRARQLLGQHLKAYAADRNLNTERFER